MVITLTLERSGDRQELFTRPLATLAELRRRHPALQVEYLERKQLEPPAVGHVERYVFGNPRLAPPAADPAGIEIVAAAGVTHEIELVAQRIKQLLSGEGQPSQVRPADVLVVFRSLADAAPLVREVFARFGIPALVAAAPTLGSAPIIAALMCWLRLDQDDWPFRQLLALATHNYFRPSWPEWHGGRAAVALERTARELALSSGRDALVAAVERMAARADEALTSKQRASRRSLSAALAAPLVRRMIATLERLPQQATIGQWAESLHELGREVGLVAAAEAAPLDPDRAQQDLLAWQQLRDTLAECQRVARWTGDEARVLSRRELLAELEDLVRWVELPPAGDQTGCVRVLSAESARNLTAPYVFLAGLSEKAFPPPNREDCVYDDAETRRLAQSGLPLASHELRSRFEMLLFYEVATRATRQLVLSYPALDAAAQPLVPSPFLTEVEQVCGPGRLAHNRNPHLSCVPPDDRVYSLRDFRVRAVRASARRRRVDARRALRPRRYARGGRQSAGRTAGGRGALGQ